MLPSSVASSSSRASQRCSPRRLPISSSSRSTRGAAARVCCTNASKVALLDMECRLAGTGVTLLDVEWDSEQSRRLNAGPVPRRQFLAALSRGGDPVPLAGGVEEVRRLGFLRTPAE